ncbi:hypothetical protein Droror1_Dr00023375 [Drosera rotundifolia]
MENAHCPAPFKHMGLMLPGVGPTLQAQSRRMLPGMGHALPGLHVPSEEENGSSAFACPARKEIDSPAFACPACCVKSVWGAVKSAAAVGARPVFETKIPSVAAKRVGFVWSVPLRLSMWFVWFEAWGFGDAGVFGVGVQLRDSVVVQRWLVRLRVDLALCGFVVAEFVDPPELASCGFDVAKFVLFGFVGCCG